MRLQMWAFVVMLGACSGGGEYVSDSGPSVPDAMTNDAGLPDAQLQACSGVADYGYVLDEVDLPENATASAALALDIDGDGIADNTLGGLLGALGSVASWDFQAPMDEQVARGESMQLFGLASPSTSDASSASLCSYKGAMSSIAPCANQANLATCGQHLLGTASFSIASDSPEVFPAVGPISGGSFISTNSNAPASLFVAISFTPGSTIVLPIEFAKISVTTSDTALMSGIIGGAISTSMTETLVLPALVEAIEATVANDCTPVSVGDCGCVGSAGGNLLDFFDTNNDCSVPLAELSSNSLIDATIRNPDLDMLDASGNPGTDGVNDHLSVGLGFSAAGASF